MYINIMTNEKRNNHLNQILSLNLESLGLVNDKNSLFYFDDPSDKHPLEIVYQNYKDLSTFFSQDLKTPEKILDLRPEQLDAEAYSKLLEIKKINQWFNETKGQVLFHYLNKEFTLAQAQLAMIKDFLQIEGESQDYEPRITVIHKDNDVTEEDIYRIHNSFMLISQFVPDEYEELLPEIKLSILSENNNKSNSYSDITDEGYGFLEIKVVQDLIDQVAIVFHEYLHAIELVNKNILKETNKFLINRADSLVAIDINSQDDSYRALTGEWIHPKVGAIYQDQLNKDELIGTEVLSLGGQLLLTKPIEFLLADPEHALLILKFLKGAI